MHQFPHLRCCLMSSSFPRFKNLIRGNRMERTCSFFLIFSDSVFCLLAKRCPSGPLTNKLNTSFNLSTVLFDVFDFHALESWTTPRTRKLVCVAMALVTELCMVVIMLFWCWWCCRWRSSPVYISAPEASRLVSHAEWSVGVSQCRGSQHVNTTGLPQQQCTQYYWSTAQY